MTNEAAAKSQSIKDECENDLAEALPALKEAEEALSKFKVFSRLIHSIYPSNINSIVLKRAFSKILSTLPNEI